MAPPTDPQRAAPPPHLTAAAEALAGRLREDAAHADRAAALGRDALTRLGVFGGDFLPAGAPVGAYGRLCRAVGLGLLAHALPAPGGWAGMDAGHVEGYVEALRGDPVEAGRLIGAFGAARLAAFGRDLKLVHRVGGYLGRPGLPLADHLIAAVVRPAAESVARQGPPLTVRPQVDPAATAKFPVSQAWARRLKQTRRETDRVTPARYQRDRPPAWVRPADRVGDAVRAAPDLTLKEYRERFALPVAVPTLVRAMAPGRWA